MSSLIIPQKRLWLPDWTWFAKKRQRNWANRRIRLDGQRMYAETCCCETVCNGEEAESMGLTVGGWTGDRECEFTQVGGACDGQTVTAWEFTWSNLNSSYGTSDISISGDTLVSGTFHLGGATYESQSVKVAIEHLYNCNTLTGELEHYAQNEYFVVSLGASIHCCDEAIPGRFYNCPSASGVVYGVNVIYFNIHDDGTPPPGAPFFSETLQVMDLGLSCPNPNWCDEHTGSFVGSSVTVSTDGDFFPRDCNGDEFHILKDPTARISLG